MRKLAKRADRQIAYKKFARKRRRIRLFRCISITLAVLAAAALMIWLCQARKITVSGNTSCPADKIQSDIIRNTAGKNTLYQRVLGLLKKRPKLPYLDDYEIEYGGLNRMNIRVYEKQPVAYVMIEQSCVLFSRDGVVLKITSEPPADLPRIEGLELDTIILYQSLQAKDAGVFKTVKSLVEIIKKNDLKPDRILISQDNAIELYFAGVQVLLGTDKALEDKIAKLIAILPSLEGRNGTLYMQNVDENTDEVSFIKAKP